MRKRNATGRRRVKTPARSTLPTKSVSDVISHRSYVFYGRSGTGKTTLSATFPKPILLLDVNDQGTDSISDIKNLKVLSVEKWDDFEAAYWYLLKDSSEYKTLVIDTISQLQQLVINRILDGKSGNSTMVTKRDWGETASTMKTWITNVRNLTQGPDGLEIVFTAQDRIFEVDEGLMPEVMLDPEVGPRLTPSVVSHLNAAVSVIGNTFIRRIMKDKEVRTGERKKRVPKTEYCLRIGPNPVYITKIRKPKSIKIPSIIVNPNYRDLIDIIKGEK